MKQWDMQHIGIFDINFDTGERYWSAEFRRILRVSDNMPAALWTLLEHVHPNDRGAVLAFAMEPLQGQCPPHRSFEHRLLDPDGAVRWVHVEAGAAYRTGSEHDVVRIIGLVTEISGPTTPPTLAGRTKMEVSSEIHEGVRWQHA
ncbi:MAG: nodulation protein [Spartobacteria bacterium]|nr:nodulation protein [Spartobacteria bacterium]